VLDCETDLERNGAVISVAIRVRGLVQGVGFRPTVWRLAQRFGLTGEVLNDGEGVLIRAWGVAEAVARFAAALEKEPPPLARIDAIEREVLDDDFAPATFRIVASVRGAIATGIAADAATCPACLEEVLDPKDRRYRYPFANCTHCGPRLSIMRRIPYDRVTTSMAAFTMCADCGAEYENPADRRFHAEPIACPVCGPRVWLEDASGVEIAIEDDEDAVAAAARLIAGGSIVAIKGIGGFHLACDAANADTVAQLRQRKHRYHKPFALMAADVSMVAAYARVGAEEARLLKSAAAPIVMLDAAPDAGNLAPEVAPGQASLGFMLPYTPLHHLLMRDLSRPIVLTSGNRSDEPQCTGNEEARRRLRGIADHWLMHDRDIVKRLDDSVARVVDGAPAMLRRARGFAPESIRLPDGFGAAPRVLAMGAELKSTFCLLRDGEAVLSQHIGDLEDAATHADYRAALELYRNLFDFTPGFVAVDCHPDYLSTQWGRALATEEGAALADVQHHHAHVAACLAEHGVPLSDPPVLAIVLDGLGLGDDGGLWGGEILRAGYRGFERLASFAPTALLGGAKAMREPWRNAFAHLDRFIGWGAVVQRYPNLDIVRRLAAKPLAPLQRMLETGLNAPLSSSAGRLFDAVAATLGLCADATSYEGQAAIELEVLAERGQGDASDGYPVNIGEGAPIRIGWEALWPALLEDLEHGTPREVIAARFHAGLAAGLAQIGAELAARHGLKRAVLSGGVFQNRMLLQGVAEALRSLGLDVLTPRRVPPNDGGIALGQAVIVAARAAGKGEPRQQQLSGS
jgi:hydrogenase maturation protein HypF